MYQLTYNKPSDRLILQFPYQQKDYGFLTSLEGREDLNLTSTAFPPGVGDLYQAYVRATAWNAGLIRKHCAPIAMTPMARVRLEAAMVEKQDKGNVFEENPDIQDWKFYRVPFRHQVTSWKYTVDNPYAALFLDMGLGKTFVAWNVLGYFYTVKGVTKKSLVVIPLSSFESWEREARLCGFPGKLVSVLGSRDRKLRLLKGEGDVFLVTYESLNSLLEEACAIDWFYMFLDESTKIKNSAALRSRACYEVGKRAERRCILTGYPVTQSYNDLFGQYKFLDPTVFGTSFHHFRNTYCVLGGWNNKNVVGYTNVKDLVERMFKRCIRYTKAQCLDLPDKMYQVFKFDLNPAERKAYDDLKKQLIIKFLGPENEKKQVTAQNALVAGLRLVQICTGYVGGVEPLEGSAVATLQDLGDSKQVVLEEVLGSLPEEARAIIWCRFKRNVAQIETVLRRLGWSSVVFTGELSAGQRKTAIEEFQAGKHRAFVGILQAGGHGLDLTAASYVVYYSQDYSIERRMQSEDRAHRIGQTRNVTYIDLVARHSLEESILNCLRSKKKESDVVFDFVKDPEAFLEGR